MFRSIPSLTSGFLTLAMLLKSEVYRTDLSSHPALAMLSPQAEGIQEVTIEGPSSSFFVRDVLTFS